MSSSAPVSWSEGTMRVLSFESKAGGVSETRLGVARDDGIVDITARDPDLRSLREILRQEALPQLAKIASAATADHGLEDVQYLPPVPNPERILCIGVNYVNRNAEYRDDSDLPQYPSVFLRTRESLVGHARPIIRPNESTQLDYEGEIAIVIGKQGRRISERDAHEYVAGLTVVNEGSVRDWMRHGKFNVTQGKNFESTGASGPWMTTSDEIGHDYENLRVTTRVNGEVRQNDTTDHLLFSFRYLIHYLSTFMRLNPGDIISTGTPNGAGARFDPPRFLAAGDRVEVEVPGVGTLHNEVSDESPTDG
jgi:2-keto-4-pentenoate hydratase/2-oxohepta-3-ene-1,7-dioic acid hydratase in catechol pathway